MEFDDEFSVAASPEETWEFLLDPESLGGCIPDCQETEVLDEDTYRATVGVRISQFSLTFDLDIEILDQAPEQYLEVKVSGDSDEDDTRVEAIGTGEFEAVEDGTHISYRVELNITGRVMNLGSRIVKRVGERRTNQTIENIQAELGELEG